MLNQQQGSISNGFSSLTAEVITDVLLQSSKKQPIFVICDACYWCATYIDDTRLPADSSSLCPQCNAYGDSYDDGNNNNRCTATEYACGCKYNFDHHITLENICPEHERELVSSRG